MSSIPLVQNVRSQRRPELLLILFAFALVLLSAFAAGREFRGGPSGSSSVPAGIPTNHVLPAAYRGYRIESAGTGLLIPELELAAADYASLCHAANRLLFRSRSGIVDPDLEKRLAAADRNEDLHLSVAERNHFLSRVPVAYRGLLMEHLDYYWGLSEEILS